MIIIIPAQPKAIPWMNDTNKLQGVGIMKLIANPTHAGRIRKNNSMMLVTLSVFILALFRYENMSFGVYRLDCQLLQHNYHLNQL